MRGFLCVTILALLLAAGPAHGQEDVRARAWLHLNGYTHHFNATDANDELLGIGLTWHTNKWGRIGGAWEADVFRDSGRKLSAYVGHSFTYRTRFVNTGITGALMHHRNFAKHNRWRVLPVALPFAELPLRHFSVRAYYIPPIRSASDHQIAFQVMIPFAR